MLEGVRGVVFDAVGTLIHPEPAAAIIYAAVGSHYGSRRTADEVAARFPMAFRAEEVIDRANCWRTSEARERARWWRIVLQVLDDVDDPEACFRVLFEHFARPSAWRCGKDVGSTLAILHARGFRLALASNYDARLRPVRAGLPELQLLTEVFISSEIGWRKPAAAFFQAVCNGLGLPPAEVLYVGDDPDNDEAGARAAGLRTLLLGPEIPG